MRLTEKDAKTKWCPMARAPWSPDWSAEQTVTACNRGDPCQWDMEAHVSCIGSNCMFWRWSYDTRGFPREDRDRNSLGYCGAAGPP